MHGLLPTHRCEYQSAKQAIKACKRKNQREHRFELLRRNNPTSNVPRSTAQRHLSPPTASGPPEPSGSAGSLAPPPGFYSNNNGAGGLGEGRKARLFDQLEDAEKKILREIAIMKKCSHGQIVQLFEVIDDRLMSKIFMGMYSFCLLSHPFLPS